MKELTAFCTTCPPVERVTNALTSLDFHLTFEMAPQVRRPYLNIPPLPAQYHYQDLHGTEVIFLAGMDTDLDGQRLPPHACRFFAYPGADLAAFRRVTRTLAVLLAFSWQDSLSEPGQRIA